MNPTSILRPMAWIRFGFIQFFAGLAAVLAFMNGNPVAGWVALGFFIFWAAVRVWLVIVVRRALARAKISPPPPLSTAYRERLYRRTTLASQIMVGGFALAALVAALTLPTEYSPVAWTLTGAFTLFVVLRGIASRIGRQRRQNAIPEP